MGTTVTLLERIQTGVDAFHQPVYTETETEVPDVLVGKPSTDDITDALNLYGKKLVYTLGIPKGDTHNWENTRVRIWGKVFQTFGAEMTGEPGNIPLRWGKNVMVEAYGESLV